MTDDMDAEVAFICLLILYVFSVVSCCFIDISHVVCCFYIFGIVYNCLYFMFMLSFVYVYTLFDLIIGFICL